MAARRYPSDLGPYTLLAPLAHDGTFESHLGAYDDGDGALSLCVVKVGERFRGLSHASDLWAEARRSARLEHGNLVKIVGADELGDDRVIAVELVEGRDLRAVMNRFTRRQLRSVGVGHLLSDRLLRQIGRRVPIEIALFLVRDLLSGIAHAHASGLVYGSVAPETVLVSWGGAVKLNGIAVPSATKRSWLSVPEGLRSRLLYLAPEQAAGAVADGTADVWAAGVILWELLAGRPLHPAELDQHQLLATLRAPQVPPPSRFAPDLPPSLVRLVGRALAVERTARVQTALELRDAIDKELVAIAPEVDDAQVAYLLRDLWGEESDYELASHDRLLAAAVERRKRPERGASPPRALPVEARPPARAPAPITLPPPAAAQLPVDPHPSHYLGQILDGRYQVERMLGEGGMGWVFEVSHLQIGRKLALKILLPQHSAQPDVVSRFRREARAASTIGHPNIVEVTDFGTTSDGNVYFVMERLSGADLGETIARAGRLPLGRALHIGRQLCRALGASHAAGIVHRDLKPENVFLIERAGDPDFVKVLDFGIAKAPEETRAGLTLPGIVMGTPEYMAPEQAVGAATDARSDIYAFGALLYEMLTGTPPFTDPTAMGVLIKKSNQRARPVRELNAELSEPLEQLLASCLERDPSARPRTMAEVEGRLEAELRRPAAVAAAPFVPAAPRPRSRRGLVVAGAGIVVAMGVGLAMLMAGAAGDTATAGAADKGAPAPLKAATAPAPLKAATASHR
jgi:serine/threonine protein kinase